MGREEPTVEKALFPCLLNTGISSGAKRPRKILNQALGEVKGSSSEQR